ncbi:hypothetical protein CRG98_010785 [Punica granatum]|uniref:BRCT domain-containing protein n=1 Tax=Punica granatum TaxID=22663 RepID=A0A2I0KJQ4_PUNGR|nr:hypothetical protein CRG98_010785 [Punica granatum]
MARLEFRHGQFSEKMAVCKGDIGDGEDIGKRNSAYSGCRLFWSGESSSQVSVAQSSGNVLHFHLHLLSYSNSSCGGSQNPNTSDLSVQSLQKVEAVSEHVEIDSPIQCEEMVRVSNLKEDVCQPVEIEGAGQLEEMIQVSNFREAATKPVEIDGARQREERVKVPKLEEAEIDHAVELSIAASEALVINELVESDSALRYLPMIAVVEMALRIKQARLEDLKNPPHGTIGGTGKDRPPVELDNISEMDAFKDVGVSSSDHDDPGICDLDVSCVEETPISKNHVNYKNGSECVLGNIGNLCTSNQAHDVLAQDRRLRKGSSVEVASKNAQNQDGISIGLPLGPGISDTPNHVDKNLHLSVGSIPNGSAVDENKIDKDTLQVDSEATGLVVGRQSLSMEDSVPVQAECQDDEDNDAETCGSPASENSTLVYSLRESATEELQQWRFRRILTDLQHNEKHHGSDTSKPSDEEATVRKSLDEFTGVAQIRPPLPAKRQLPLILNPLKRRRIQLSRYLANDSFSKEKHSVEPEPAVNIHWGNIFNKMQLQGYCPTADQAPQEKRLRTAKFLYGCAIKCLILDASWLTDSISAGSIESPEKYMIISYQTDVTTFKNTGKTFPVFEGVGIMLHGKRSFYTKFATIIKHGGGQAFKTLQQLLEGLDTKKFTIGTIVTEFESATSRHLRHCAMERNVPVMPASWIVESLYAGKLFPLPSENYT